MRLAISAILLMLRPATSIAKVHKVLNAFRQSPWLGVAQIARATKLLPSDVHRILQSLANFGFIEQNGKTREYRLGIELLRFGELTRDRLEIRRLARPQLQRLASESNGAVKLLVCSAPAYEPVRVEQIECATHQSLAASDSRSSLEKLVVFAFLAPPALRGALDCQHLKDTAPLRRKLAMIRQQGFLADGRGQPGWLLAGAPLSAAPNEVSGVITVEAPLTDVAIGAEHRIIELLMQTAQSISELSPRYFLDSA